MILDTLKIGSIVKVNPDLSLDRLSQKTLDAIDKASEYVVEDFKITDGKGIGVVIKLSNGQSEWFFENEIELLDENGNIIKFDNNKEELLILNKIDNFQYVSKLKIKELLNPLNFLSWIIFSLKDNI